MGHAFNRVRAGSLYRYEPVPIDRLHPPYDIEVGQIVRVVNLNGCPKANTMEHAHVEHLGGAFAGLVCTNSVQPLTASEKRTVRATATAHCIPTRSVSRHKEDCPKS